MSKIWEYIKIAIMNIKNNRGRSILTMLGIIIGISSVIMIISIGNGVKGQINDELTEMQGGLSYLMIDSNKNKINMEFTQDDFDAIEEKVAHVKGVTPCYQMNCMASGRKGNFDGYAIGGNDWLEFYTNDKIIKGRYFSKDEYESARKVCIITEATARKLFGTTNVVGMDMEVSMYNVSQTLTIIGVRADSQSSLMNMMGANEMLMVEMPITVMGASYGFYVEGFTGFYIGADTPENASQVAKDSIRLMEARHNVRGENMFQMQTFQDQMSQINTILGTITIFVVFVAAISLLVGGIGVMNIMLVSVTERTREIGIRKALGARTRSILTQFLSESAIITLLGGIIGIAIGTAGAYAVCSAIGFHADVRLSTILVATLFSSGVGIFFGIYPAKKAAKLSPIEALRHE